MAFAVHVDFFRTLNEQCDKLESNSKIASKFGFAFTPTLFDGVFTRVEHLKLYMGWLITFEGIFAFSDFSVTIQNRLNDVKNTLFFKRFSLFFAI